VGKQVQHGLLQPLLQRRRDVGRSAGRGPVTGLSQPLAQPLEEVGCSDLPGAVGAVRQQLHQLLEDRGVNRGVSVGGEAHDLVLVTEGTEPEVGRDDLVQHPERVGQVGRPLGLYPPAVTDGPDGALLLPVAVQRHDQGLVESRAEECSGSVGQVVPRPDQGDTPPRQRLELSQDDLSGKSAAQLGLVRPPQDRSPASIQPTRDPVEPVLYRPLGETAVVGHEVDIIPADAGRSQAVVDRSPRQDRLASEVVPMLDPGEALL
jgi:hypothetical protein